VKKKNPLGMTNRKGKYQETIQKKYTYNHLNKGGTLLAVFGEDTGHNIYLYYIYVKLANRARRRKQLRIKEKREKQQAKNERKIACTVR